MTHAKIRSVEDACRWRRETPGRVVFTNGVFDLLHPGHVVLLERARALGDALVVGINTDASAGRLEKGPGRPIIRAPDRARVIAALAAVDCVVLFDEDTPDALVRALTPDVLAKGADYAAGDLPGRAHVLARGGDVTVIDLEPGYSTSAIIERVHATT